MELFPQYIRHLKKFISAIEKSHPRSGTVQVTNQLDIPRNSTDFREKSRPSTDQREKARVSVDQREKPRSSTDCREKVKVANGNGDRSRKLLDRPEKVVIGADQPEKARNSIDRCLPTSHYAYPFFLSPKFHYILYGTHNIMCTWTQLSDNFDCIACILLQVW